MHVAVPGTLADVGQSAAVVHALQHEMLGVEPKHVAVSPLGLPTQ